MPGVACLDLWGVMMRKAGWEGKEGEELIGSKKRERSEVLGELLSDGVYVLFGVFGEGWMGGRVERGVDGGVEDC
jgi:hypothetical protein